MLHADIVGEETSFAYSATFATSVSSAPALEASQVLVPDPYKTGLPRSKNLQQQQEETAETAETS